MGRLEPYFPKSQGKHRVDDRRILSGIVFTDCNVLQRLAAQREYGPHKTLYDRWMGWRGVARRQRFERGHEPGVFARIMAGLAAEHGDETTVMIDATHLEAHRTASSLGVKNGAGRLIGRTAGGMNTKLHANCDSQGRPIDLFLTAGPVSDYIGARAQVSGLPNVKWLLGDRGYDADWFREALQDKKIRPCIPGRNKRKTLARCDKRRNRHCKQIEVRSGRFKGWRRGATRYDRCSQPVFSAIELAATVIFWL